MNRKGGGIKKSMVVEGGGMKIFLRGEKVKEWVERGVRGVT